jgi:drug/metabolite transporter (DMT)-like permease
MQRQRLLLALLVSIWAVSWPVIKVGVAVGPPLWFGCFRYIIATAVLFILVALRGELALPTRSDVTLVVVSGVLQMGAFSALTGLALTKLPPGRASVLAFSTPLWVAPLAAWRLGERLTVRAAIGVAIGLLGVLVIASPALQRGTTSQLVAYAMLMTAAAGWAVSIVAVRGHRFTASPLALAPWQMLVAAALLAPVAFLVEGSPTPIPPRGVVALAYVGPLATAFAYWAVVEVGRHFPARTISMALLATPSLGLLISALTLHERITVSLGAGLVLVLAGIRLAIDRPEPGRSTAGTFPRTLSGGPGSRRAHGSRRSGSGAR